ncbi:FixH family protein [Halalkalibacter urbisdiaboli]|uniref:FixH family protein n=1 Tax=Halalkalibacter urbisdiaboli TaxID=1960589 RepID=UPI000B4334B6|nr:FixH family protein [Halalkalibacter urbisdiaboli]
MKVEHQQRGQSVLYFIGTLMFIVSMVLLFQTFEKKEEVTNWTLEVIGTDEHHPTGKAVDIQLFLRDEMGVPIEDASITLIMDRPSTVHNIEKVMHHVEDGLYESEVIFSLPGTWIGIVEVNRGKDYYQNQFLYHVNGRIVSKQNRDPADVFQLDQPLPNDIKRELK